MKKNSIITLIILAISLINCEKEEIVNYKSIEEFDINSVPIHAKKYIEDFINDAKNYNINIDKLTSLQINYLTGENYVSKHDEKSAAVTIYSAHCIDINYDIWSRKHQNERKAILYHELGHFIFHKEHNNEIFANGLPKSIMYKNTDFEGIFFCDKYIEYYLDELFLNSNYTPYWSNDTIEKCSQGQLSFINVEINKSNNHIYNDISILLKENSVTNDYLLEYKIGENCFANIEVSDILTVNNTYFIVIKNKDVILKTIEFYFRGNLIQNIHTYI